MSQTTAAFPAFGASLPFLQPVEVDRAAEARRNESLRLPEDLSDEELVQRLSQRDRAVFLHVYREHAAVIGRVLNRMGIPPQDIEDLLQTTFAEALAGADRFEGRSTVRSWLLSIALNQSRNYIRSRVRARANAPLVAETLSQPVNAEVQFSGAQQNERLQWALEQLPALQKEALVLCELSELPAREVSALLGVPLGTVWRRVHDAKNTLRKLLEENLP